MKKHRVLELRATIKTLTEQRNDKVTELQAIVNKAKLETRAMTEEEKTQFETLEKEITEIDNTIAAETRARGLEIVEEMKDDKKLEPIS